FSIHTILAIRCWAENLARAANHSEDLTEQDHFPIFVELRGLRLLIELADLLFDFPRFKTLFDPVLENDAPILAGAADDVGLAGCDAPLHAGRIGAATALFADVVPRPFDGERRLLQMIIHIPEKGHLCVDVNGWLEFEPAID